MSALDRFRRAGQRTETAEQAVGGFIKRIQERPPVAVLLCRDDLTRMGATGTEDKTFMGYPVYCPRGLERSVLLYADGSTE